MVGFDTETEFSADSKPEGEGIICARINLYARGTVLHIEQNKKSYLWSIRHKNEIIENGFTSKLLALSWLKGFFLIRK